MTWKLVVPMTIVLAAIAMSSPLTTQKLRSLTHLKPDSPNPIPASRAANSKSLISDATTPISARITNVAEDLETLAKLTMENTSERRRVLRKCESQDFKIAVCTVQERIKSGGIAYKLSNAGCEKDRDYIFFSVYIIVANGCRAYFSVDV